MDSTQVLDTVNALEEQGKTVTTITFDDGKVSFSMGNSSIPDNASDIIAGNNAIVAASFDHEHADLVMQQLQGLGAGGAISRDELQQASATLNEQYPELAAMTQPTQAKPVIGNWTETVKESAQETSLQR